MRELLTIEDFRDAVMRGESIVITGTKPKFHPSAQGCDHIDEDAFRTKVIQNGGRNGRYFAVASMAEALARWPGVSDCFTWT